MLKYLVIQNIGSIKDEVSINFEKGGYTFKDNMVREEIVNPIGIFGSNGSGKTILLRSFNVLLGLMNDKADNLSTFIPNIPSNFYQPSYFEVGFTLDSEEYQYIIKTNIKEIISEELIMNNDLRFFRSDKSFQLFKNDNVIKEGTVSGDKYPAIRQVGNEEYEDQTPLSYVKKAFNYLSNITYIDVRGQVHSKINIQKSILDILEEKSEQVKEIMKSYKEFPTYDLRVSVDPKLGNEKNLEFSLDNGNIYLPEVLMSNGMKAHSTILSTILSAPKGSLIIVDELERSLHPFVAKQFVEEMNSKFDIQMIFSSHNTNLLQSMRPDQIIFSKWNADESTSTYWKLSEVYPKIREINNIEKMYYGGQFDE
jgi:ABC-type transporter Mla maintaining outer membrane lipid asymmetry ATPase subunit MlaF